MKFQPTKNAEERDLFLKFTDHLRVKVQHQAAVDEVLRISRCDMAASNDPGTMSKCCVSLFGSFVFRLKVMESDLFWAS